MWISQLNNSKASTWTFTPYSLLKSPCNQLRSLLHWGLLKIRYIRVHYIRNTQFRKLLGLSGPIVIYFCVMLQVLCKEREYQRTREIKEDFSSRIHAMSEKLKTISNKLKEKSPDVEHAKEEVKVGFAHSFSEILFALLLTSNYMHLLIFVLRVFLKTWTPVVIHYQSWTLLYRSLAAETPYWPNNSVML